MSNNVRRFIGEEILRPELLKELRSAHRGKESWRDIYENVSKVQSYTSAVSSTAARPYGLKGTVQHLDSVLRAKIVYCMTRRFRHLLPAAAKRYAGTFVPFPKDDSDVFLKCICLTTITAWDLLREEIIADDQKLWDTTDAADRQQHTNFTDVFSHMRNESQVQRLKKKWITNIFESFGLLAIGMAARAHLHPPAAESEYKPDSINHAVGSSDKPVPVADLRVSSSHIGRLIDVYTASITRANLTVIERHRLLSNPLSRFSLRLLFALFHVALDPCSSWYERLEVAKAFNESSNISPYSLAFDSNVFTYDPKLTKELYNSADGASRFQNFVADLDQVARDMNTRLNPRVASVAEAASPNYLHVEPNVQSMHQNEEENRKTLADKVSGVRSVSSICNVHEIDNVLQYFPQWLGVRFEEHDNQRQNTQAMLDRIPLYDDLMKKNSNILRKIGVYNAARFDTNTRPKEDAPFRDEQERAKADMKGEPDEFTRNNYAHNIALWGPWLAGYAILRRSTQATVPIPLNFTNGRDWAIDDFEKLWWINPEDYQVLMNGVQTRIVWEGLGSTPTAHPDLFAPRLISFGKDQSLLLHVIDLNAYYFSAKRAESQIAWRQSVIEDRTDAMVKGVSLDKLQSINDRYRCVTQPDTIRGRELPGGQRMDYVPFSELLRTAVQDIQSFITNELKTPHDERLSEFHQRERSPSEMSKWTPRTCPEPENHLVERCVIIAMLADRVHATCLATKETPHLRDQFAQLELSERAKTYQTNFDHQRSYLIGTGNDRIPSRLYIDPKMRLTPDYWLLPDCPRGN